MTAQEVTMSRKGLLILVMAGLLISGSAIFCGLVYFAFSSLQTEPDQSTALNPNWLTTATELNQISDNIGVIQWQVTEDMPGQNRICRIFQGESWSATPNTAMNGANSVTSESTFEEIIDSMYIAGILYPSDTVLQPVLTHNHDFALYTHMVENGHSVYDAFMVGDDVLFKVTVTLGTPLGYTNETLFEEQGEIIEAYLKDMLMLNLEKSS